MTSLNFVMDVELIYSIYVVIFIDTVDTDVSKPNLICFVFRGFHDLTHCFCVLLPGPEPLHVHASDLNAAPLTHRISPSSLDASLPSNSQHRSRLRSPPRPPIHSRNWRYPGVYGRAHRWHQTPWSSHGPQPAGQADDPSDLDTEKSWKEPAVIVSAIYFVSLNF